MFEVYLERLVKSCTAVETLAMHGPTWKPHLALLEVAMILRKDHPPTFFIEMKPIDRTSYRNAQNHMEKG